jgi:hypothetical protein
MLVVDAANVVGSRPNGWWRDRAKAAENLCCAVTDGLRTGRLDAPVVVVLEGAARHGAAEQDRDSLRVVHAPGSGDDAIVELVVDAVADEAAVTAVTADRELRERVQRVGGDVVGPSWLLDRIEPTAP